METTSILLKMQLYMVLTEQHINVQKNIVLVLATNQDKVDKLIIYLGLKVILIQYALDHMLMKDHMMKYIAKYLVNRINKK